jgi:radical SAM superfamily enzyme YgiQ (UPF0313 family)
LVDILILKKEFIILTEINPTIEYLIFYYFLTKKHTKNFIILKMTKVLLVNPCVPKNEVNFSVEKLPPLGLAYLAAVLERDGIECDIHDDYLMQWGNERVAKLAENYDIVGITGLTATSLVAIDLARRLDHKFLISGGPHSTLFPYQMIEFFDCVVKGEGEQVITDIVKNRKTGIIEGIKTEVLDELPMPARHKLPMESYPHQNEFLKSKHVYSLNTSRGCPYNCSFCSVRIIWGKTYRSFSPGRVGDEVRDLITKYGADGLYFREDNFTYDRKRVVNICKLIGRFEVEWVCESRVEHLDEELIKIMYDAGCRGMWFGTESGSDRVLKMIHKGVDKERAVKTFRLCQKQGIKTGASFILGLPGETRKEMYDTLRFANNLDSYWTWFNYYLGIPGSDLYNTIIKDHLYEKLDERKYAWVRVDGMSVNQMIQFHRWIKLLYHFMKPKRIWRLLKETPPKAWFIAGLKIMRIYRVKL